MRNKKGSFFIGMGLLLIAAALFLAGYNLWESHQAELSSRQVIERLEEYISEATKADDAPEPVNEPVQVEEPEIPDYVKNPGMEMPVQTIDGVSYIGVLQVPVLELELPVISQWSYPNLKTAPCRYSGSAYLNNLIICGHNYTSHFGTLKNLREGDNVTFTDMDGNMFLYQVVEQEILQPTAIEDMEAGDWDLTLFTCTVGGRTRVTIRCTLLESQFSAN